ncbi:sensor histidine kinase [Paractinoplanes durhamensis]|uniref:histidine kinase n=1 Tax=Paractinoplanes durhamensis TaxID=113563 RepID=A0ABQ3YZJ5_9ACTN|nr:histidine kinase [Actinoplanes durhamensis]GIE03022.1 two-component sensor histidine kinase [Actinoplanes durhamensis]
MIDVRRIPDRWQALPVAVRDLPLALLMVVAALLPPLRGHGTQVGELPDRPFDGWVAVVLALECLPLIGRRRRPAACLALVSAGFAADQVLRYHTAGGTALAIALISAGAHLQRHRRLVAVAASTAYIPLAFALDRLGSTEGVSGFATFYLFLAFAWGIGVWLRQTRAAEAERRQHVAEATRVAERTRIARELHDVVTHHVTAMVVQAEAARYLTAAPERLDESLTAVSETGRLALTDLRHLLDLLNPGSDATRAPTAGDLSTLVEQTRRSGQPVELTEEGGPALKAGSAEMVAYRVVQEALTNALKYAHGSHTGVHVRRAPKEITVEVCTDGSGPPVTEVGGSGRGLTGLRDRVELLGGEFTAGRQPGGGFAVRARIPS